MEQEPHDSDDRGDRGSLAEIEETECWRLLAGVQVGRLAWCEADGPVLVPVNHSLADGTLLVRTAPWTSMAAHVDDSQVAYEVDGVDPVTHRGWSVLVRGRGEVTYDADPASPDPWPDRSHAAVVRIHPDEVTGRRLT